MNPKPVQFFIALGAACFLAGILAMQMCDYTLRNMQTVPTGMVEVTILELCTNAEAKKWTLLQASDGQRCYMYHYRGNVGDHFYMWPEDLRGYKTPNALLDLTMSSAQIELGPTIKTKEPPAEKES